jgi:hypothetical protein
VKPLKSEDTGTENKKEGLSMMRRTILLGAAFALTYALAPGASADLLTGATWTVAASEDFTSYDPPPGGADPENISYIGKLLGGGNTAQRNCSIDPWFNDHLCQYRGLKDGGTNNVANLQVSSTTYLVRDTYRGMGDAGVGDTYQRVSFRIRSAMTTASDYTAEARASSSAADWPPDPDPYHSNGVPMWDVSNLTVRPHVRTSWDQAGTGPEWIGPAVDISGGAWHTMDLVYSLVTGDAEWYKDGALVATLPNDPNLKGYYLGRPANNFEFWQRSGAGTGVQAGTGDNSAAVMFDDIVTYNGVPEPAALALLGLGSVLMLKRRRA